MKSQLKRISLFPNETTTIVAIVERPNGTTFKQRLTIGIGDSVKVAIDNYQKRLGDPYKWVTIRGKHQRILRSDAYLVVDYYIL